eukprot:997855-Amphidinium_carterae.1
MSVIQTRLVPPSAPGRLPRCELLCASAGLDWVGTRQAQHLAFRLASSLAMFGNICRLDIFEEVPFTKVSFTDELSAKWNILLPRSSSHRASNAGSISASATASLLLLFQSAVRCSGMRTEINI